MQTACEIIPSTSLKQAVKVMAGAKIQTAASKTSDVTWRHQPGGRTGFKN